MSSSQDETPISAATQLDAKGSVVLNRTCQGCRIRKTRCIIIPGSFKAGNSDGAAISSRSTPKCVRCTRLSLDCVFLPPAIKRKRKRNETRIKELEKKLLEIQAAVVANRSAQSDASASTLESQQLDTDNDSPLDKYNSPGSSNLASKGAYNESETNINTQIDPVSSGLVNDDLAHSLYWTFCNELAPIYPLVLPPLDLGWSEVRQIRPALFRSVLSAASSSLDPKLFKRLSLDIGKFLAEKVIVDGEKSLDLVQALIVLSTWYHPPQKFQELKFSQYANMAATMVMDLRSSKDERYQIPTTLSSVVCTDQIRETCRTFLACYFLCSSMALSLRRPTALKHGSWVDDCVRVLEAEPTAHINDRRLVEWVKLQRIAEESLAFVGLEDGSVVDFSDAGTRFVLTCGVKEAIRWKHDVPKDILTGPMLIHYHMILISLHEPALYDGHDLSDFRPPYTLRAFPLARNNFNEVSIEVATALTQCIISAQTIIHTFLGLSDQYLRSAPIIVYTRITYAVVVLIKFDVSARMPQSAASLLDDNERNPKILFFQLLDRLGPVIGWQQYHVPAMIRGILSRMAKWYIEQFEQFPLQGQDEIMEPMMHLSLDDARGVSGISDTETVLSSGTFASQTPIEFPGIMTHPERTDVADTWDFANDLGNDWMTSSNNIILDFPSNMLDFNFSTNEAPRGM